MKGDFSRFIFDKNKHYTGVLMQQGRVQLDSDWNEQVEINAHQRQIQAFDVIGPCGMPAHAPGFEIIVRQGLRFDGKDEFVYAGKDEDLSLTGTKSFALETWINPQPEGHGGVIAGRFAMFENFNLPEYVLFINPDKTLSFLWVEILEAEFYESIEMIESEIASIYREIEIEKIALRFRELRTMRTVPFGKFSHIAMTFHANEITLFIDGYLAGKTRTGKFQSPKEGMFFIGTGWFSKRLYHVYQGVIDRLTLWNTGLSPDRIRENMYTFLTGKEPGLLRLWRFNRENEENLSIKDWSPHNKPCILGAGRQENAPGWEPPFIWIGKGRSYLNGILCENNHDITFAHQPSTPGIVVPQVLHPEAVVLFYLEVWQRHIIALQDPQIREVALGGADTTTRMQTIWQVKYIPKNEADEFFCNLESKGKLNARRQQTKTIFENRLYRVEIHTSGGVLNAPLSHPHYPVLEVEKVSIEQKQVIIQSWQGDQGSWETGQYVELYGIGKERKIIRATAMITAANHLKKQLTLNTLEEEIVETKRLRLRQIATFKWSKENGTIVFPLAHVEGNRLVLKDPKGLGTTLSIGQWVEVLDDHYVLQARAMPLVQIKKIDHTPEGDLILTLNQAPHYKVGASGQTHPLVRVWDQKGSHIDPGGGVIPIQANQWLDLDEGVQVYFEGGGVYHSGDYWWMPVRSDTQELEWPEENHQPVSQRPHGIRRHYSPLAIVDIHPDKMEVKEDLRHIFEPLIKYSGKN